MRVIVNRPAGGVGIFLSDKIEYFIRDDLSLGINGCEDLWVEIKTTVKVVN